MLLYKAVRVSEQWATLDSCRSSEEGKSLQDLARPCETSTSLLRSALKWVGVFLKVSKVYTASFGGDVNLLVQGYWLAFAFSCYLVTLLALDLMEKKQ